MAPVSRELLERYLQGACTPDEERQVIQWLDENDIDAYEDVHTKIKYERKIEAGWKQLTKKIKRLKLFPGKNNLFFKRYRMVVAATIALLIGVSVYIYYTNNAYEKRYQTAYGEIKRINLVDGTTVTLNACSSLEVKKGFNDKNRKVFLNGEAYFEVKQKMNIPFIVNTGKLSITALGTAFDVSAFSDDPHINVSLKEGKVLVKTISNKKKEQNLILKPGEGVTYKKRTSELQTEKFNSKVDLAWQRQVISFENADMLEVVRKLERFYGVTFDTHLLQDRHWQLKGEYKNQTLQDVLESLSFNYNLKYRIKGKKVILYEK